MATTSLSQVVPWGLFPSTFSHNLSRTKQEQWQQMRNLANGGKAVVVSKPTHHPQDDLHAQHKNRLERVRRILIEEQELSKSLRTIDSLQQLGIDYHFKDEIESILSNLHAKVAFNKDTNNNLFELSLSFRLLRQARYPVSTDVFGELLDRKGGFKLSIHNDIKGMLSLYEASFLNTGEELLYEANAFTSKHLLDAVSKSLDANLAAKVMHTLEHPYHISVPRYRMPFYLGQYQRSSEQHGAIHELAKLDFDMVQSLHQAEAKQILSWWKDLGLAEELTLARDQPIKWYMWLMNGVPHPKFSSYRVQLTKLISLFYILDDIFDVYGTISELALLTEAIKKWELSDTNTLPNYMRKWYKALYNITNEIAQVVLKQSGWNPINSLKKMMVRLCNAFLLEAKWFSSGHVPNTDEYLENAVISSGVHAMFVPLFFLLGEQITKANVELIENNPNIITYPATILRLWDDLGSAKDKNQRGYDGSYVECYKKENPKCSTEVARYRVMQMISYAWEGLNRELIRPTSFSSDFVDASLNTARLVRVMYAYSDDQTLPLLSDYAHSLLYQNIQ